MSSAGSQPPRRPAAGGTPRDDTAGLLAEVAEDAATGDIARVYGELRSVAGYDLVPLFYRVLAGDPAALYWAWHVLQPAFRRGVVAATARAAELPDGRRYATLPAPGWELLGLSATDLAEARLVVSGFNSANPFNLVVVLLLEQALRDGTMIDAADAPFVAEDRPGIAHRPPLALAGLPPAQISMIEWLSTRGGSEPFVAAPTLWRCLAHWPPLLAMAAAQLEPLHASGATEAAVKAIRRSVAVDLAARSEAAGRRSVAAPEPAEADHVLRVTSFFGAKVPEMIFTGHLLQVLLAEA
ncbi:MAG: hypothetical protein RIB84_22770 [Sneathiellaceae bacterium]